MPPFTILGHTVSLKRTIGILLIIAVSSFLALVPGSFYGVDPLTSEPIFTTTQQRVIAIFVFTALMWIFELIPTWATSVVSIVIILLTTSNKGLGFLVSSDAVGALINYRDIMASFADPVIMLFLGGFVLAFAASKVGMDVQLAKVLLKPFGTNPKVVLLGMLLIIGFFSMFMSNTATAAMMLTFLTPVLATLPKDGGGRISFALAIPIAANLGGMGTPIGTPPNAIALGALQAAGYEISFFDWMIKMVPYVIVMLLIAWFLLTRLFPFKTNRVEIKIEPAPNKASRLEKYLVAITFIVTIALWIGESVFKVNSNVVAMIPFAVFASTGILKARELEEINWSVLWMVAGGFALGTALNQTGLASTLIQAIPFSQWNPFVVMIVGGLICHFLSNFISNSAASNLVVPILVVVGKVFIGNPEFEAMGGLPGMIVGVAISASVAMALPVSTPPNALAHSTGMVTTKQMATVGIIIGVIGLVLGYTLLTIVRF